MPYKDNKIKPLSSEVSIDIPEFDMPKFNIPELDISIFDILKSNIAELETPKFSYIMSEMEFSFFHTPVQDFGVSDEDNRKKLEVLPGEMWLHIFSYLSIKEIIIMRLTCKFLRNITNSKEIINRLDTAKLNKKRQSTILSDFFTHIPRNHIRLNTDIFRLPAEEEEELYQPDEQGFIMRKR